jgi:hypothetical protein
MRRLFFLIAVAGVVLGNAGCLLNAYSPDPNIRMTQLLNQSEDLRQIGAEWRRIWFTNQPSSLTYERVSGAMEP